MSNIETRERELEAAAAAVETAENHLKECEAEYREAEAAAPRFTQTDLAKAMARESQARRAGLIA